MYTIDSVDNQSLKQTPASKNTQPVHNLRERNKLDTNKIQAEYSLRSYVNYNKSEYSLHVNYNFK